MGIPPEMLSRVFDLFTQVDRTLDRSEGGLGIGLTLVRRLTEMHGGSVEAFSPGQGQGSEFVVRLPLAYGETPSSAPSATAAKGEEPAALSSHRILVVDDNRDSADSLAKLLRLFGNDVRTAYEGRQAVLVAQAYQPDLVCSISVCRMNGYEVAKQIRSLPGMPEATFVALTGFGTDEDRRQTHADGFDHHLVKPVDVDALRALLTSLST